MRSCQDNGQVYGNSLHALTLIAQLLKNQLQCRRPLFDSWVGKIPWRRDRLPPPVILGFPCGSAGKESACNVRDLGSIPGLGRSSGEGKGYPLQCSGLENSMDGIVHGVTKSQTRLTDFHFHYIKASASVGGSNFRTCSEPHLHGSLLAAHLHYFASAS